MKKLLLFCLLPFLSLAQPGTLDTSFDPGTGASNWVWSSGVQSDEKIIIGGDFTSFDETDRSRIARLNTDGSLDTSFNPGSGANSRIQYISIQSDGKIIICGYFNAYNGTSRFGIARLNTDGSLDTSFNPGSGVNLPVFATAVQNDGKILMGGQFTFLNGTAINRIARLNSDGSIDTSFDVGTGTNAPVETISIQDDGKIIIGGNFRFYNGIAINRIARLNTDGSLDTTFDPGSGANNWVYTATIQNDGKIILGGEFTTYNGTTRNHIARINTDGSLDSTFDPGTGTNNWVYRTAVQSDGKIIISGIFTAFSGTTTNRIARLNSDGSRDTSFDIGMGSNNLIFTTSLQGDGKIIIGGSFISYDGAFRNYIARVNTESALGVNELENDHKNISIYPNPFSSKTTLYTKRHFDKAQLTIYNAVGQLVKEVNSIFGTTTTINRDHLAAGIYFVRLTQDHQLLFSDKLIVKD